MKYIKDDELERLLQRAKQGNQSCLDRLCSEIRVRLAGIVKYRLRSWSQEDREDLVQSTLLTFYEKIQTVERTPVAFALWIMRLKIGNKLQEVRFKREHSLNEISYEAGYPGDPPNAEIGFVADSNESPEELCIQNERMERILRILPALSEFCRALIAGLVEGFQVTELWARFSRLEPQLNRNAFYKRIHDCRQKTLSLLGGER